MPNPTTAGLVKAVIAEAQESGDSIREKSGGKKVTCMFNPFEYSISQSNNYEFKFQNGADVPKMEFSGAGSRDLSLKLVFDSYEEKTDVSLITRKLWDLMRPSLEGESDEAKKRPPPVVFRWGHLEFFAVIKSCKQNFTMFLHDGTPVRAEVDISFSQHLDSNEYTNRAQNPTSGGGPMERVWQVKAGDRLDLIASRVYEDATKWRLIADRNGLTNPLALRAGQRLRIPPK